MVERAPVPLTETYQEIGAAYPGKVTGQNLDTLGQDGRDLIAGILYSDERVLAENLKARGLDDATINSQTFQKIADDVAAAMGSPNGKRLTVDIAERMGMDLKDPLLTRKVALLTHMVQERSNTFIATAENFDNLLNSGNKLESQAAAMQLAEAGKDLIRATNLQMSTGTALGRALNARKIKAGSGSKYAREGAKSTLEMEFDRIFLDLDSGKVSKEGVKRLRKVAETIAKTGDTSTASIKRALEDATKPDWFTRLDRWITMGLLSAPKSNIIDAVGTGTFTMLRSFVEEYGTAAVGQTRQLLTGKKNAVALTDVNSGWGRTFAKFTNGKVRPEFKAIAESDQFQDALGQWQSMGELWLLMRKSFAMETDSAERLAASLDGYADQTLDRRFADNEAINKAGKALFIFPRLKIPVDEFFQQVNASYMINRMAAESFRTGKQLMNAAGKPITDWAEYAKAFADNLSPEDMKFALDWTREGAFRKELGTAGKWFVKGMTQTPARYAKPVVAPFITVPINLLKESLYRVPGIGVLNPSQLGKIKAGGKDLDGVIARQIVGLGIGFAAYTAYQEGLPLWGDYKLRITGGPATAESQRATESSGDVGYLPYSWFIDDGNDMEDKNLYSYNQLDPIGSLFGLSADVARIMMWLERNPQVTDDEKFKEMLLAFHESVNALVVDKTYLQGFVNLGGVLIDPQRYGEQFVNNLTGLFVPNLFRTAVRGADPTIRETAGAIDAFAQHVGIGKDTFSHRWLTDVLSLELDVNPPRYDVLGNERRSPAAPDWFNLKKEFEGVPGASTAIDIFAAMFVPFRSTTMPGEDTAGKLLYENAIAVQPVPKTFQLGRDLGSVRLTPEERSRMQEIRGKMLDQLLEQNLEELRQMPPAQMIKLVQSIRSQIGTVARSQMFNEFDRLQQEKEIREVEFATGIRRNRPINPSIVRQEEIDFRNEELDQEPSDGLD